MGALQLAPGLAQAVGPQGPEPGPPYLSSQPPMLKLRIAAKPGLPSGAPKGAQMCDGAPLERWASGWLLKSGTSAREWPSSTSKKCRADGSLSIGLRCHHRICALSLASCGGVGWLAVLAPRCLIWEDVRRRSIGGLTFIWVYFWLKTDICVTLAWELSHARAMATSPHANVPTSGNTPKMCP